MYPKICCEKTKCTLKYNIPICEKREQAFKCDTEKKFDFGSLAKLIPELEKVKV